MLKFSGYPYLIRGQPCERFNGRGRPHPEAINEITTLGDGQLSRRLWGARNTAAPNTKPGLSGEMTLEQACPPEYQRAQCAFKDSMIHWILQFTLLIAFRCVLHRCQNQEIRCWKFCLNLLKLRRKDAVFEGLRGRSPSERQGRPRSNKLCSQRVGGRARRPSLGNDPSAGSPTETLLRLLLPLNDRVWPTFRPWVVVADLPGPVRRPHWAIQSVVATGGVYKGQGRNQRMLMTCAY